MPILPAGLRGCILSKRIKALLLTYVIIASSLSGYFPAQQRATAALTTKHATRVRSPQSIQPGEVPAFPKEQLREIAIEAGRAVPSPSPIPTEWGVARQLDEHTWTMQVGQDTQIATVVEIFTALNSYRQARGRGRLTLDEKLTSYAQSRADNFEEHSGLDSHAGFHDYLQNQEGFHRLGFAVLGENSSFGYRLSGVHLIEWVYAGDKPHDDNQLNSQWTHVGIGIAGTANDLIFGGQKL